MSRTAPHYLLLSETKSNRQKRAGRWRFVLERMDGSGRIEVADEEPDVWGERLQLLVVVRGLEALEQPSRVTLITPSRYVGRGIRNGLDCWRESSWQWERFGEMTSVKNADLWRRVDRAMDFHKVDCRVWNFAKLFSRDAAGPDSRFGNEKRFNASQFRPPNRAASCPGFANAILKRADPRPVGHTWGYA